jgi:hypothetical protein
MIMKKILTICIALLPLFIFAQKEVGYLINEEGGKIVFYENVKNKTTFYMDNKLSGDVNLTVQFVHYYDMSNKAKRFKQSEVAEMSYNNQKFIKLPIGSLGRVRLHTVIAENDNYILTNYYHDGYFFYVFEKDEHKVIEKKKRHSVKQKLDNKLLEKKIKLYFKDCPELIVRIKKGIADSNYEKEYDGFGLIIKNNLFKYVYSGFNCSKN